MSLSTRTFTARTGWRERIQAGRSHATRLRTQAPVRQVETRLLRRDTVEIAAAGSAFLPQRPSSLMPLVKARCIPTSARVDGRARPR